MKDILLNNRYRIKDIIGTGGMSIVYDGYDTVLNREVAIKILKDSYLDGEKFLNKLKMEAVTSASISDDNIVSIYDVGTTEIDGRTIEYIVMEKINGRTLKQILNDEGPLENEKILNYALQITKALQTAHIEGIIHRDIKPQNILITNSDKVKVVDFGIARVSGEATITYTSSILGTVHYISPEQAKGQPLDSRSDLYSLGVVLYEMATGKVPFDGESPVSIAVKHIQEVAKSAIEINPNLNPDISRLIDKLLKKDPNQRYKTASNLLNDLEKIKMGKSLIIDFEDTQNLEDTKKQEFNFSEKQKVKYKTDSNNIDEEPQEKKKNLLVIIPLAIVLLFGLIFLVSSVVNSFIARQKNDEMITVPSVIDVAENDAIKRLEDIGLQVNISDRIYDENIIEGNVISQSIQSRRKVETGSIIDLVISKGQELIDVPKLIGLNINDTDIESILNKNDLVIGSIQEEENEAEIGEIINQDPKYNEKIAKNSSINIIVSKGLGKTQVPNILGYDIDLIENVLKSVNLELGEVSYEDSEQKKNKVISQDPLVGTEVDAHSKVNIVVSTGNAEKNMVIVPNVQGLTEEEAIESIKNANLFLRNIKTKYSNEIEKGLVIEQSLEPQSEVEPNTEISLVISNGSNSEISGNTTQSNSENDETESSENNHEFVFNLQIPDIQNNTFNVKIVNTLTREEVYNNTLNKNQANGSGIIQVKITDKSDSDFEVYYNNQRVNTSYE